MTRPAPTVSRAPIAPEGVWPLVRAASSPDERDRALQAVSVGTPDESVLAPGERRRVLSDNLLALRARDAISDALSTELARVGEGVIGTTDAVRASDGHVLLRHQDHEGAWSWLGDVLGSTETALQGLSAEANGIHEPIIQCGAASPVVLLRVHERVRAMDPPHTFRRGILVVHEDTASLAAALTVADLRGVIEDDAVSWMLGADAEQLLETWIDDRPDDALPKRVLHAVIGDGSARGAARPLSDRIGALIGRCAQRQRETLERLSRSNDACLADVTLERARAVLRDGALGQRALRVLICTSRHTTYTRHSAEGLRDALETLGHESVVLIESTPQSVLSAVGYARAVDRHRPDLIVMINYPRTIAGGAIPKRIPFVTWIQDAMQHLLDPRVGASMDGWDLYAGSTMASLWEDFGYRPEAAMPYPVTASEKQFAVRAADPDPDGCAERYRCDVAFVSHHSESPQDMLARLTRGSSPDAKRVAHRLWDDIDGIIGDSVTVPVGEAIDRSIAERFSATLGRESGPEEYAMLRYQFMEPLVGRVARHRILQRTVRICTARGWSLRIFGNGWDRSEFAPYALPAVDHGNDLARCYRGARAHLHIDLNTITHQRVFECALAGGLPLMLGWAGALLPSEIHAIDELVECAQPEHTDDEALWYANTDGALASRLERARRAIGLLAGDRLALRRSWQGLIPGHRFFRARTAAPFDALEVLGPLDDVMFTDEASLERALERAIHDEEWREQRITRMRQGISSHTTTEVFAQRLLEHGARVLGWREREERSQSGPWTPIAQDVRASYDAWMAEVGRA